MEDLSSKLTGVLVDEAASEASSYSPDVVLPVTLVAAGEPGERMQMVSHDGTLLSTLALQGGDSAVGTTQFYIEQFPDGQTRLKTADGRTLEIGMDPTSVGAAALPVLLQVSPDGTLLQRDDVQIALAASDAADDDQPAVAATPEGQVADEPVSLVQEEDDNEETMLRGGEPLPLQMYLQVGKEMGDDSSSLDGVTRTGAGTAVAIVTPDGDESDVDDPPAPGVVRHVERLEDFMDVVTTYRCKFCRFSCAWRSGLMSHFRSCHVVAPQESHALVPTSAPSRSSTAETSSKKPVNGNTATTTTSQPPQKTAGSGGSALVDLLAKPPGNAATTDSKVNPSANVPIEVSALENSLLAATAATTETVTGTTEDGQPGMAQERHIFICGQCSQGFGSLDSCKEHMIEAHDLKVESAPETKRAPTGRKRGRPRSTPLTAGGDAAIGATATPSASYAAKEAASELGPADGDMNDGNLGKRKVRPPKSLEDDYMVSPARRRRTKKENSTERLYRCGERSCGYRFRTEESLDYHVRCHTPAGTANSRPYTCPECGEQRDHWRSLAMHLWRSHLMDLDLHRCTQCNYRTFSAFKLENHARIHSEERDFTCAQCGKGFKQLSQLRNHHVVHLDRKNTPHKRWYSQQTCDLCQRTFSDSKCLRKHHQAVHGKVKPYVCNFCGHMSARKAMLQLHLRQHTGEKPFACNLCEYRTGDHNSLRRHKMRHSGTRPYKCPHCPYACIQAISYKMHMKNKHPGLEGLFACSLCNFRSVSKENFTNHMSDHKRGILANASSSVSTVVTGASGEAQTLQLPEGTLQQLEGILPGNLNAAQLIYSCLSALQQEGGPANLPPGVTTYSAGDGTQTITIQVPPSAVGDDSSSSLLVPPSDQDQFYLTVQQQEDGSMAYLSGEGFAQGDTEENCGGLKISAVHTASSS